MSAYENVVRGKLKLKGGPASKPLSLKPTISKPKITSGIPTEVEGKKIDPSAIVITQTKTRAELAYEATLEKRERDRVSKMAEKSFRDQVEEYNKHLASLSEHHDIPKVDPRNQ